MQCLEARFTFVVGKGGVGKSTTAAALALRWADGGRGVHLLSTDPAHSLADLFTQELAASGPTPSTCSGRLLLEELDASARARAWLDDVRGPVAELLDLGTYLDRDDVEVFLERSLPGMDEVMAVQRLVELERSGGSERVVVDTAPTGHLLRMLEAGTVLAGWQAALGAMAAKAGAVATGLTGQRPRFDGEVVVERLRDEIRDFRHRVLEHADFVVVTRADAVVEAEAERLETKLIARGCVVRARVAIGGGGVHERDALPTFDVPWAPGAVGCDDLRSWPGTGRKGAPAAEDPRERSEPERDVVELLDGRDLYLFVGKGGVGKTTCAAAFALALGRRRDVLLLGVDPAGSLGDVLAVPVGHEETACAAGLRARELDAEGELERVRERYRDRIREVFERLGLQDSVRLDRNVLESILDMAPAGVDEIFALDAILEEATGRRAVVVDTAPTGHLLRLLEMPELARSWTRALLHILLRYRSVLGLDDFASRLLGFARRLDGLIETLGDARRAAAVVVTLEEPLPRRETDRLLAALRRSGTPVAAVLHNRLSGGDAHAGVGVSASTPVVLAPLVQPPPVGVEPLLSFVGRWRLA